MGFPARVSASVAELGRGLVQRSAEARILLLAAVCGEHVLMLGPPGTAKSELARRLARLGGQGAAFFERLLTRFSVPEELFGPLSLRALERDEYVRRTAGYLPEATVAFVDEIFKANSAILNSLLTIVNERVFDNGSGRVQVPLRCLVAASNEPPESEELDALFDRFLFRLSIRPVTDDAVADLIAASTGPRRPSTALPTGTLIPAPATLQPLAPLPLSAEEAEDARVAAAEVEVPPDVVEILRGARRLLAARESPTLVSDRRLGQAARMLQVVAWTCGRLRVERADCALLRHVLWSSPDEEPPLRRWLEAAVARTRGPQIAAVLSGLLDRAERGSAPPASVRAELAALRGALAREVSLLLRQQALLRQSCWLAPDEADALCRDLDRRLDDGPRAGPRALLAEVARLDEAAELGQLEAYIRSRRAKGELVWTDLTRASAAADPLGELEGPRDETFEVGKHRGRLFSEVAADDEDYCRMVERKVAEGQFAKDTPLDRQIRAFVAFLRARGGGMSGG